MKATLRNIAKNLKKSSKVHAKQSKQIENIMKKSPAKNKNVAKVAKKTKLTEKQVLQAAGPSRTKSKIRRIDQKSVYSPVGMKNAVRKSKSKASALKLKKSPALAKLSASCKAAAKRKFKVYPSAYANMWASKTQKAGKC